MVQVEYSADLLSKTDAEPESSTVYSDLSSRSCPHKLFVHIPISIFKFYLHRILLASLRLRDDPVHSIMLFFQKTEVLGWALIRSTTPVRMSCSSFCVVVLGVGR